MPSPVEPQAPIAPHAGPLGRAAGILFLTPEGETLLLLRGDGGDFPRHWGFPGGHLEEGETDEQAARREALEETGFAYDGPLEFLTSNGQFATFIARDVPKFDVKTCDESMGFVWCRPADAPPPLHPGITDAFEIAAMHTELDAARLVQRGVLPSPTQFANSLLFAIRITGTGQSYRSKLEEHVWRDPSLYLNDEFCQRCNGLPVVWQHPEKLALDTVSFAESVIGTIMFAYIQGDEVWGIARILDVPMGLKMAAEGAEWSTSPGTLFNKRSGNATVALTDGSKALIEGNPNLIDHIAICELGVWDKNGPPMGVQVDQPIEVEMTEEEKARLAAEEKAKADAAARADSAGPSLGDILKAVSALSGTVGHMVARLDSVEKNMPSPSLAADARKDAEEKEEKARKDAEEKEKAEAKARADAEEKERADEKARADADAEAKRADADEAMMADCQARADSVYQQHGKQAPRAMAGEKPLQYRRRLLRPMQAHSTAWKDVDLSAINDAAALGNIESVIYADAARAAQSIGVDVGDGLREIRRRNDSGHNVTTFAGRPGAWMAPFSAPSRALVQFNKGDKQ